ncbi:MAG: hypothetical protein AB7D57_02575, partial [Desulfovibrionaceae bacterium]
MLSALCACTAAVLAYGWGPRFGPAFGPLAEALLAGGAGLLAAGLLSLAATGRPPRVAHALLDVLIPAGLTWAADPALEVWQAPTAWGQLFHVTPLTAAALVLGHFVLLGAWLTGKRRHPSAGMLAVLPAMALAFNWLLLLQSPDLLQALARGVWPLPGLTPYAQDLLARAVVLAAFNEGVAVGLNGLLSRIWLRNPLVHALLLGSAVCAAVSPLFADLGSDPALAALPGPLGQVAAVACVALASAGLWAQTYLMTGFLMDAFRGRRPTAYWGAGYFAQGMGKGAVYAGLFLGLIFAAARLARAPWAAEPLSAGSPWAWALLGTALMPLLRTLVESFDGSAPIWRRLRDNCRRVRTYARGVVVGVGTGLCLQARVWEWDGGERFAAGLLLGAVAYAGVDLLADVWAMGRGRRLRFQSWRVYLTRALLGGCVAGAMAWYLDASQSAVILAKFWKYATLSTAAAGQEAHPYVIWPLFSKWGAMDLGLSTGGVRLLYNESVSGVINWSLAAPLFSVNLVFLTALFQKSLNPVRQLFSREGVIGVAEQTVRVLRWGLWMAPVIYSFLRISPDPSWYNQDGAFRSLVAIYQTWATDPAQFRAWSIQTFLYILAYDWFRILIWLDHMGLRVATLVNLSFVGGDALDELLARFQGHPGRARCIPEGLRRFATWAPLLIPFFLPMGADWDYVWVGAETIQKTGQGQVAGLSVLLGIFVLGCLGAGGALFVTRLRRPRSCALEEPAADGSVVLRNGVYALEQTPDGRGFSRVFSKVRRGTDLDLTTRPAAPWQVTGKFLYLWDVPDAETDEPAPGGSGVLAPWSLTPQPVRRDDAFCEAEQIGPLDLRLTCRCRGIVAEARVHLPPDHTAEVWRVQLRNDTDRPRRLELASYRELSVNDRNPPLRHPFFNRMHVGTWFSAPLRALFAVNRLLTTAEADPARRRVSGEVYFHAAGCLTGAGTRLVGYEDNRTRFLGGGTLRRPDGLALPPRPLDRGGLRHTFDPMAGLRLAVDLPPGGEAGFTLVDGYAPSARAG